MTEAVDVSQPVPALPVKGYRYVEVDFKLLGSILTESNQHHVRFRQGLPGDAKVCGIFESKGPHANARCRILFSSTEWGLTKEPEPLALVVQQLPCTLRISQRTARWCQETLRELIKDWERKPPEVGSWRSEVEQVITWLGAHAAGPREPEPSGD